MKKFITIFVLIWTFNSNCQSFNLGFKYEPFVLIADVNNVNQFLFSPISFSLLLGCKVSEKINIEINPGIIFLQDYFAGSEIGINAKYFLNNKDLYITGGILTNFQRGSITDSRINDKIHYQGIIGVGSYLERFLFIQISYQFPIANRIIDHTVGYDPYDYSKNKYTPIKLVGLIKLGLGFSFDL